MRNITVVCVTLLTCLLSQAADPTYWGDVRPLLRKHCTVCHREAKLNDREISAGLAVDTIEALRKNPKVLKPGEPDQSLLVTLLTETKLNRRMPLDTDPLSKEEIALIRNWVATGAKEGTRPNDSSDSSTQTNTSTVVRKLPVTLTSLAALPRTMPTPGPISLTLPIGPNSPIAAVAIDPSGKSLATGSYGRVTIWNLTTGQPIRQLTNILGSVNDLKFSPAGDVLAVAGGQPSARGDLRLFDTKDWKLIASLGGHLDVITSVSFHPDGKKIVSASFDKTLRLWEISSRKPLHTFTGHSDFVYGVAFSPKGDWYATASKDRTSRLVETANGKSKLTFSGMDLEVMSVAVRADGSQVVTSGAEPQLHWWDATTGERVRKQTGHNLGVNELAFNHDGKVLASAGLDGTARTWDPATGNQIRSFPLPGVQIFAVVIDPQAKRLVAGGSDGLTRVFDATSGRLLVTLWSGTDQAGKDAWFILSNDGYYNGSDPILSQLQWSVAGKPTSDAKPIIKALAQPKLIATAIQGEKPPEPKFEK